AAAQKLSEGLERLKIPFYRADPYSQYKDANERLLKDREGLRIAITEAERAAEGGATLTDETKQNSRELLYSTPENPRPYAIDKYLKENLTNDLSKYKGHMNRKTGFDNLDKQCGSLYPGLYLIGAITSLGKTTFIHQMGDQLAAAGDHILYFSLEQNRLEMVTKSLSRITGKTNKSTAESSIDIRGGKLTKEVIAAAEEYYKICDHVNIVECNFNTDINFITKSVIDYMKSNSGIKPVVIIDYLQIIPPPENSKYSSDKDKIDGIVRALKKMQSENDLIMFVVSSINRANYLLPIDMESFKESGGIEFTADVVWGLQLQALNDPLFEEEKKIKAKRAKIKEAKRAIPREIELVCLKNRYGISSYSCGFIYYPQFDLFEIDKLYDQGEPEAKRPRR
ncbi:MAG: hypothetical protein EOM59_19785, partial [Clostridia bacterium]|nr:hypothetical protein [Clostridia bacterium]